MPKRISLLALKKRANMVAENTRAAGEAKRKRREERRAKRLKKDTPDFELTNPDGGQTHVKDLNSYHVQAWFREGITKRIGWSISLPSNKEWWGGKQRHLAKALLAAYGGELVKKAIFYLCDNWEEMVKGSNGKLSGIPTVELLWGGRDRIFPDAEIGRTYIAPSKRTVSRPSKDVDEWVEPEDEAVGHGW